MGLGRRVDRQRRRTEIRLMLPGTLTRIGVPPVLYNLVRLVQRVILVASRFHFLLVRTSIFHDMPVE